MRQWEWGDPPGLATEPRPRWRPTPPVRRRGVAPATAATIAAVALGALLVGLWTGYVTGRQHPTGYPCPLVLAPADVPTEWVQLGTGLWFHEGKAVAFSAPASDVCVFA